MDDAASRLGNIGNIGNIGTSESFAPTGDLAALSPFPATDDDSPITIEAHDRQQLEVRYTHALHAGAEPFSMELYFFIPRNVGVTSTNYPRDEFYGDLTSFMRLDLPDVTLEELADPRKGSGSFALFGHLQDHIDAIGRGELPNLPFAVEVKLFGHAYCEAVRDSLTDLLSSLRRLSSRPVEARWQYLDQVDRFAETARAALLELRRAMRRFEPLRYVAPSVTQVFHYTDEYSSLFLDGALSLLAHAAEEETALFDGTGFVGRLRQTLARHAHEEATYRAGDGYLNLSRSGGAAEYFAYRQSFLKKTVQQALYVDTRRLASDTFTRNTVAAVAASLAATWALVAQIPARLTNLPPALQTAVVALPVIAYVAKDRIKELTKEWLLSRTKKFDTSSSIALGSLAEAGLGNFYGRVQERVSFLELPSVPSEIMDTRVVDRTVRGAELGQEVVLDYRRLVELGAKKQQPVPRGMGLRQIVRLNLRHFLTRLDEPRQLETHYSASDECFLNVEVPKVYHINLITRVVVGARVGACQRWRVVLNKKRIVRLETVKARPPRST